MKVATIMTTDPVSVRRGTSIDRVMELMDTHDVRHLPVLDDEGVVGILSDRDVLEGTGWLSPREREIVEAPACTVVELMRSPVTTCSPQDGLAAVLGYFVQGRIGCLPVVQGRELAGIVTETDLLRAYVDVTRRGDIGPELDVTVDQHMTRAPAPIAPDASGDEAAAVMEERGIRHLPVVDGDEPVGMLSDRDVRRVRGRGQLESTLVREMMTPNPQTIAPDARLSSVASILTTERIGALPVVDGGRLVGLVSSIDVMIPCTRLLQRVL